MRSDRKEFLRGFRDAFPVFVSYFAVSIALGITARNIGFSPVAAGFMSLVNLTSAGQAAGLRIMAEQGTRIEIVLSQVAINLRYMLMSAVLATRLTENTGTGKRMLMGFGITDEIFGLSAKNEALNPFYTVGCFCMATPGWVAGTVLGVVMGNLLPVKIVEALSMALYGMFISLVFSPAKKNYILFPVILFTMLSSYLLETFVPVVSFGMRVIFLTLGISALAAVIFPVKAEKEDGEGV
ncbi:MAG: AzlC family ABC transporter permease [Sphaerochaetaceae bacterium]|nr:AzlC family ABC transporter permease [Sphaerochaetaceae bacterium]